MLSPLIIVYAFVIKIRNYLFDKHIYKSKKVDAKVISVGNIVVGGSGKTPTTIYITEKLKQLNKNVGVLSRGYGRETKGYHLVSSSDNIHMKVEHSGDEIFLVASECLVPTAVSERRVEGAELLINEQKVDTIVLDDAFQHRWIERDLDVVVFDQRFLQKVGSREQKLLPLGVMREPFTSLERADVVIINRKFADKKEIPEKLKRYFKNKKLFWGKYKATGMIDVKTKKCYDLSEFVGQKSLIICGIAQPFSFLSRLEKNNIDFKNKLLFNDHKNYTENDIQKIRKQFYDTNSYSVLTTQKDAVKLSRYSKELDDIDIYYLKIELELEKEEEFLEILTNIN